MRDRAPDLAGRFRIYERPSGLSVAEFARTPGAGELVRETENVWLNAWYLMLFNLWAGLSTPNMANLILSIGTGTVSAVSRVDTAVVTEWKRFTLAAPVVTTSDPPIATYSFFSPAADGVATFTNAGLYGDAATTQLGNGTALSHLLISPSYARPSNQDVRFDYTIQRSAT
jgi:hypothetical protein